MNKSGLSSFGLSHPFQADAAAGAQLNQLDAGELVKQLTFARSNKPDYPAGFVDRLQPVGLRLVRPEDPPGSGWSPLPAVPGLQGLLSS